MLSQADKDKLKALGINADELETAIKADKETAITLPQGQILTDEQLTQRDANVKKDSVKEVEAKVVEIAKKEILKHAGIEIKSDRWGDIGTEIKTAINSTGDDKVKTLQEQNRLLLADKETLTKQALEATSTLETRLFEVDVMSALPKHPAGLSPRETMELAKMRGYSFEKVDGNPVVKKGNEILSDPTTRAALPLDAGIKHIYTEQKWDAAPEPAPRGGRGAAQKPPTGGSGGIKSRSQAEAAWNEMHPDKNMATAEGLAWYNEQAKQPDFNMYE